MATIGQGNANVVMSYQATNITTNTTTNVNNPGVGLLHAIVINTKGASSNTIAVKDGTTTLGTIDSTASIGTLIYDIEYTKGLQIVTATGTAPDITVVWK